MLWRTEHDHLSRARALGHGKRRDADRTRTLHHHIIAPRDACAFHAVDGRVQRAAGAHHCFRRKVVRDLENVHARLEVMIFRIAAKEMRRLIAAIPDAIGAALWATRGLMLLPAVIAFAAGSGGSPCHTIADLQWLSGPVLLQALAELFDATDRLVPENHRQRDGQLAFPEMNVRAANPRHDRADQRRARLRFGGNRILTQLQWRLELFEHGSFAGNHAGKSRKRGGRVNQESTTPELPLIELPAWLSRACGSLTIEFRFATLTGSGLHCRRLPRSRGWFPPARNRSASPRSAGSRHTNASHRLLPK